MKLSLPDPQALKNSVTFEKGKPPAQQPYFGVDAELYLTPEYLRGGEAYEPIKASVNAVRVSDGDTVVLWDGSNAGEVFRARQGVLSSTMTRLKHRDTFNRDYFYYAVKRLEPILKAQTAGSGIPHVDKQVLGNLPILNFSEPEQSKIAEIFFAVDNAIQRTDALLAKQHRLKFGLMVSILTKGVDGSGSLRSTPAHTFKASPVGEIPNEWDVLSLSEATSRLITYGIVQPGPQIADGIPFIQTKNLSKGRLDYDSLDRTSKEIHAAYERSMVRKGDIVIGIRASVGCVAEVPPELDRVNISRGIARLSPSKRVTGRFLFWVLQAPHILSAINLEVKGSTYPEITLPALRNISIPVPRPIEQLAISSVLDRSASEIGRLESCAAKLRSLKLALMDDLLTGRKCVTSLLRAGSELGVAHA